MPETKQRRGVDQSPPSQEGRGRRSAVLFVVSALLVTVAAVEGVALSEDGGAFSVRIRKITANLRGALSDLPTTINFTDYTPPSGGYVIVKKGEFRPRGMQGLYNLTKMFVNYIAPDDILMKGLITFDQRGFPNINPDVPPVDAALHYGGIATLVIVLALMVVLFPFCGLCFCFCRCCCGRCGARPRPADKRRDLCKKVLGGAVLIALSTGLLFCVVCSFASNQQLHDGIDDLTQNLRHSVDDTQTYLDRTKAEASMLLDTNFKEFATVFTGTLSTSSDVVMAELEGYSNATAMLHLADFVETLPKVETSLERLKTGTNQLRVYASQLNDAMRKVKNDLLNTLKKCDIPQCKEIERNVSTLQTQIDFNKLPDMTEQIENLNSINIRSVIQAAAEGKNKLNKVKNQIHMKLESTLKDAASQIETGGHTASNTLRELNKTIDEIKSTLKETTDEPLRTAHVYIEEYKQYRYYVGLALSCVLLLVSACLALGLICGVCGKRPDGYTDNCCNKGAGANFLICAVTIMFTAGGVIAVVALASFLIGIVSDGGACRPLRHIHEGNRYEINRLLNRKIDLGINITLSEMMRRCHGNNSAYYTFNLKTKFNMDEMKHKFNIEKYMAELDLDHIINERDFEILSATSREELRKLQIDLEAHSDKFSEELLEDFTNVNITVLSSKLEELINLIISKDVRLDDVVTELQLSRMHLDTYNEKILEPMKREAKEVVETAKGLDRDLKMNHSSFSEAVQTLLEEIDQAETSLKVNGNTYLKEIANEFATLVRGQVGGYLDRVSEITEKKLGRCGPLSAIYNATLVTVCDKVLLPWNGFWFSQFWALILFIVTIIVSVMLSKLYQKYKQYGPYLEARSGKRSKKKSKSKKGQRYEEADRGHAVPPVTAEFAQAARPSSDARYADMAPKHWEEFPNGGPPQYQRAPTEYERPPPYYYPAASTQGDA